MRVDSQIEAAMREQIIADVMARAERNGGFLTRDELLEWVVGGQRMQLIDNARGIRNPSAFESTLSIVSSASGPYDDLESAEDGLFHYAYEKGDPNGRSNRKLRNALDLGVPLILFRKEIPKVLTPIAPVFVIGDDTANRTFTIAMDEAFRFLPRGEAMTDEQKRYALRLAKQRLHQPAFRTRVLYAYERRCAVCELRHPSLLDAAHIVPDNDPRGLPTVTNGLAMCRIHHAAYDQKMLGVSPDYKVSIAGELLAEVDGPMLRHGIQEMDGRDLWLPRVAKQRPSRELLAVRYEEFLQRV